MNKCCHRLHYFDLLRLSLSNRPSVTEVTNDIYMTLATISCEEEVTYHYRFLARRGGPPIIHPGKHPHYKYIILQYTPSNDTPHFFVTSKKNSSGTSPEHRNSKTVLPFNIPLCGPQCPQCPSVSNLPRVLTATSPSSKLYFVLPY